MFGNSLLGRLVEGALPVQAAQNACPALRSQGPSCHAVPHLCLPPRAPEQQANAIHPYVVPVKAAVTAFDIVWSMLKMVTHRVITEFRCIPADLLRG